MSLWQRICKFGFVLFLFNAFEKLFSGRVLIDILERMINSIYCKRVMHQVCIKGPVAPFGLTLIPACLSNHIPSKVWDEITYPFVNFIGATFEV